MPPVLVVAKVTAVVEAPLHKTSLEGWLTCPVGLTVMVNVFVGPVQLTPPLVNVGVTTMVAITGQVPLLTAVNEAMFPVPEAARPMLVVLLVQAYVVVPPVLVVSYVTVVVEPALQTTWLAGWFTWPSGFTVTVTPEAVLEQLFASVT